MNPPSHLRRVALILLSALSSTLFAPVALAATSATPAAVTSLTLTGTNTFLSGSTTNFSSGSTLNINGAFAGTPTGGTLSLANLTLTLPTSQAFTTPNIGAATGTSLALSGTITISGTGASSVAGAFNITGANLAHGAARMNLAHEGSSISQAVAYGADASTNGIFKVVSRRSDGTSAATAIDARATGVSILGTTTNENAATGYVGEYVSSAVASGSAVSLTTATAANVTSISLTAGDWDVSGSVAFNTGASTTVRLQIAAVSSITASRGTVGDGSNDVRVYGTGAGVVLETGIDVAIPTPTTRFSISGTTTVYLVAEGNFGVSTMAAYGMIRARRVR